MAPFANQSLTYVEVSNNTTDTSYLTDDQSFSVIENNSVQLNPDLTCSISGTTLISFRVSSSKLSVSSWITIDSSTGTLTVVAPSVTNDTEFDFYISSYVDGYQNPIQKLIKLTVVKCLAQNCQKWTSISTTSCAVWYTGYILNSGTWKAIISPTTENISSTAQTLSVTSISLLGATFGVVAFMSLLNTSSLASLWSMINQVQLFFLLLLTRAFIPVDPEKVITGARFVLNLPEIFNLQNIEIMNRLMNSF